MTLLAQEDSPQLNIKKYEWPRKHEERNPSSGMTDDKMCDTRPGPRIIRWNNKNVNFNEQTTCIKGIYFVFYDCNIKYPCTGIIIYAFSGPEECRVHPYNLFKQIISQY